LASGLTVGNSNYSFGIYTEPLETEFGWSRTEINTAFSIGQVVANLTGTVMGFLSDTHSFRYMVPAALFVSSSGWMLFSFSNALWNFYLAFTVSNCMFIFITLLVTPKIVARWFGKKKGRMMGIIAAGNNTMGLLVVQMATAVERAEGWRWTARVYSFNVFFVGLCFFMFVRDFPLQNASSEIPTNEDKSDGNDTSPEIKSVDMSLPKTKFGLRDAMREPVYWRTLLGCVCTYWTYSSCLSQLFVHFEAEGFSDQSAASAVSVVAFFGIFSKLFFGRMSEITSARWAVVCCLTLVILSCILFIASGTILNWVGAVIFGFGFGGIGAVLPLVVVEQYGPDNYGKVMGSMQMAYIVPAIVGPIFAGYSFDQTGHYKLNFLLAIVVFAVGDGISFWCLAVFKVCSFFCTVMIYPSHCVPL
jgi:sugar phosphate permease